VSRFWRFFRFPKICGIDPKISLSQKSNIWSFTGLPISTGIELSYFREVP